MSNFSALSVASYFIELAGESDENDLTNLKLQKLLYFAQGEYLARFGNTLFRDDIEAWKFGPVIRAVYSKYKTCGAFPITVFDYSPPSRSADQLPEPVKTFLKKRVWENYGKYSASYLISRTHKLGGPWREAYREDSNAVISLEALRTAVEK
jgi:uncharacterized phage-associated protein